jgi:hypothetical protein
MPPSYVRTDLLFMLTKHVITRLIVALNRLDRIRSPRDPDIFPTMLWTSVCFVEWLKSTLATGQWQRIMCDTIDVTFSSVKRRTFSRSLNENNNPIKYDPFKDNEQPHPTLPTMLFLLYNRFISSTIALDRHAIPQPLTLFHSFWLFQLEQFSKFLITTLISPRWNFCTLLNISWETLCTNVWTM